VGTVVEIAAERMLAKYSNLASNLTFQPTAVQNLGASSRSTLEFMCDLGHKLSSYSGEERASSFLDLFRCRCNVVTPFYCTTPS